MIRAHIAYHTKPGKPPIDNQSAHLHCCVMVEMGDGLQHWIAGLPCQYGYGSCPPNSGDFCKAEDPGAIELPTV